MADSGSAKLVCPTSCAGCGDEFDLVLIFAPPFDWIHIRGYAMLSDGSCVWGMSGTFTSGAAIAIIEAILFCEGGLWYLGVSGCFSSDGSTWTSCTWLSNGVAGSCPPAGSYPLTQEDIGCTVAITTSTILDPE